MLNMLDNIIVLESSMFFYYDYMPMIVSCDMCDMSCDHDIILNQQKWNENEKEKKQKKWSLLFTILTLPTIEDP